MIIVLLAADSTLLLHYGAVQTSAAALAFLRLLSSYTEFEYPCRVP